MQYKHLPPPDYLKDYVRYFWTLESDDVSQKTFGPLADGCPGIMFQSESGQFYGQDNKQLSNLFLYGQTVKRTEIYLKGKFQTIGICFHPNTLKSIFGFNANELTDSCLNMDLLSGKLDFRLSERLLNTPTTTAQVDILSAYLFKQIQKNNAIIEGTTQYALSQIITSKGSVSLRQLQEDLKLTERSFERKFNQYVGISPKTFSKVCRFQASLSQLRNNNYKKLSDIAFDNGYADQSHFIRTFKAFTGYAPFEYQKQSYEVIENLPVLKK